MPTIDEERLAAETCQVFLKASHLKDICRYRGFNPPSGGKTALVDFVAARILESSGVDKAIASLETAYLGILHLVAMSEMPPCVRDLSPILNPKDNRYESWDTRADFNRLAEGLLNRGIVLVHDGGLAWYTGESRFARLALLLPEKHRHSPVGNLESPNTRPWGHRSSGQNRAGSIWGRDYATNANNNIFIMIQIESPAGVGMINNILDEVEGIDAVMVASNDFGLNAGDSDGSPTFAAREELVRKSVLAHGKILAGPSSWQNRPGYMMFRGRREANTTGYKQR